MQSRTFTIILAVVTVLATAMAGIQLAQHDLSAIFGSPAHDSGTILYDDFKMADVKKVSIVNTSGEEAVFEKSAGAWRMIKPTSDRADYRDLQRIIYFSRNLRIRNHVRREDTTLEQIGMRETAGRPGGFRITLFDGDGENLCEYRLGRRTAWHGIDEKTGRLEQTFFIRPTQRSQKDNIYVCSAASPEQHISVRQILDRGFHRLRDHHPFLFNPTDLAEITIHQEGSPVVVTRASRNSPWRLTKPLTSRTKPEAMAGLLKGLYELKAVAVHRPDSVTRLPDSPFLQFDILRFDAQGKRETRPIVLKIQKPDPKRDTVFASVDSRPGVLFELPFKPTPGIVAVDQLPRSVDHLRGRTLAALNIQALKSLSIHGRNQEHPIEIYLGRRNNRPRWMVKTSSDAAPANEAAIDKLLRSIMASEVLRFASDAPTDLAKFGLNPPRKRLVLRGPDADADSIDILLGHSPDGRYYAMRRGTSTVAEIDPRTYTAVGTQAHEWRDDLLMQFSIVDLLVMKVSYPINPPMIDGAVTYEYDFLDESWKAEQYGEMVSSRVNSHKANGYLKFLEGLRVDRWLTGDNQAAIRALRTPALGFSAVFKTVDESGQNEGLRHERFWIAPASPSPRNRYFYGQREGDSNYFLIGLEKYRQLKRSLLDP